MQIFAEICSTELLWPRRMWLIHAFSSLQAVLTLFSWLIYCPRLTVWGSIYCPCLGVFFYTSCWHRVIEIKILHKHCWVPLCVSFHSFTSFIVLDTSAMSFIVVLGARQWHATNMKLWMQRKIKMTWHFGRTRRGTTYIRAPIIGACLKN